MRVLVVSNLYHPRIRGGYELAAYNTVNALRARGHEVGVLTASAADTGGADEDGVWRTLRLTPVYDPEFLGPLGAAEGADALARGYLYDPVNVDALLRAVATHAPDVVYLWNLTGVGPLGLLVGVNALGLPAVLHLMDYYPETVARLLGERGGDYVAFVNRALRPSLLCCSNTVRQHVESVGIRCDTRVLYNWVELDRIPPRSDAAWTPDRVLRLAYVGQLLEAKGVYLALEAVAALAENERRRVRLDLIGRGSHAELARLHAQIAALRLAGTVTIHPPREHDHMLRTYRDYDVLLFATHHREPFAFVPVEAMAAGLVVVLGDEGGNAEIARDGENCLWVRRDATSIAEALRRLLGEPALVGRIGGQARSYVARRHDVGEALDAIEETLRGAIEGRDRRHRADVGRVSALNDAFQEILPFLRQTPRVEAEAPPLAPFPPRERRAEPARGLWAAARFVGPRLRSLPRRIARTSLHLLRLDSHIGHIGHRLQNLDAASGRALTELRHITEQLHAVEGHLASVARRLEGLGEDLTVDRRRLDGLGQGADAARAHLHEVIERLGKVQQKGDATNTDLGSLVSHLRYLGMVPDPPPPSGQGAAPAGGEWPLEVVERCVVCDATSFTAVGKKDGLSVVRCESCGLLLVNPRLRADARFQLYASSYWEEHMRRYQLPTFWERLTVDYTVGLKRVALVNEFLAGRTLLDIGCSNGTFVRRAAEWGFESYGLELTAEMAAEASRLSGRPVFAGDLTATTGMLGARRFDHASMFDLIEHIYDPHAFLRNLHAVMNPGGRAFIETFRTDCPDFEEQLLAHDDVKPLEHAYMYREAHLDSLFGGHGFTTIARRHPLGDRHSRVIFVIERSR